MANRHMCDRIAWLVGHAALLATVRAPPGNGGGSVEGRRVSSRGALFGNARALPSGRGDSAGQFGRGCADGACSGTLRGGTSGQATPRSHNRSESPSGSCWGTGVVAFRSSEG